MLGSTTCTYVGYLRSMSISGQDQLEKCSKKGFDQAIAGIMLFRGGWLHDHWLFRRFWIPEKPSLGIASWEDLFG